MIKNFSWNFFGWVDLENVGFSGTPVDDRYFTPEYLATALPASVKMAKLMDGLGYDAFFTTEHHFQHEGVEVVPNTLLLALHLAGQTSNLRFGSLFNIIPQWHPIRLAEDYAMADILTKGRIIFGVGRGSQTREVEAFGAPMLDQEKNRDLFEDQMELLLKAFHGDKFTHHSDNYDVPRPVPYRTTTVSEVTVVPKPLYNKDVWQAIASAKPRGIEFMAKHDIKGVFAPSLRQDGGPASSSVIHTGTAVAEAYQASAAKYGRDLEFGENLAAYLWCHVADSKEQAALETESLFQENFKRHAGISGVELDAHIRQTNGEGLDYKGTTLDQLRRLGDPRTAAQAAAEMGYVSGADRVKKDRAHLFGPADTIIETLKEFEAQYPGMDTVILHPVGLLHAEPLMEQMERFAKEVMPAFPNAIHTNRTWPDLYPADKIAKYHPEFHRGPELAASAAADAS